MAGSKKNGDSEVRKVAHFVMMSKGGVGKSYVASLICQYLGWKKRVYKAYDTDPLNKTLKAVKSLNVIPWQVLTLDESSSSPEVDDESFDRLIIDIDESDEENFVVDTGSTSFIPFNNYVLETDVFNALKSRGVDSAIHCVFQAGAALRDCMFCFNGLCKNHNTEFVKIFVWLNGVSGNIVTVDKDTGDVTEFEDFSGYKNNKDKVSGIVRIPHARGTLLQNDIHRMISNGQSIDDYYNDVSVKFLNKMRIFNLKKAYIEAIGNII